MQWYYAIDGEQKGPVDEANLKSMLERGEISQDDFVWNQNMGDSWEPASNVPALQGGLVQAPEMSIPGTGGATHNRDLMAQAREALKGNWGVAILIYLIYNAIVVGLQFLPYVGPAIIWIIAGPFGVGLAMVFLSITRERQTSVSELFDGFNQFGTAIGAYILTSLFILLWSLLLIIPGIIAAIAYSMTFFIIADNPTIGPLEAIRDSKEMMRGNKWKYFCLQWRFFWWSLLCLFTCGIGFLWLYPYISASIARFYDDIKPAGVSGVNIPEPADENDEEAVEQE